MLPHQLQSPPASDHAGGEARAPRTPGSRGWIGRLGDALEELRAPRLRAHLAGLRRHEAALGGLAAEVERRFVAIGRTLPEQAACSAELVRQGQRLLAAGRAGADGEPPAAEQAAALVEQTLSFAEEHSRQTESLLQCMERYDRQIGRLLAEEQRVERILAPLRIIQTLFRIEAAVLPADVQVAFVALSGEIPKFEAKVREAFAQHSDALTDARRKIESTVARLRDEAARHLAAIAATRASTGGTLSALTRELVSSRERDSRLEELLRRLDDEAGRVVVSLQYQDITRQKMEHVLAALRDLCGRHAGGNVSHLHRACQLEALQARGIEDDLTGALAGLSDGVGGILAVIGEIERTCWARADLARAGRMAERRVSALRDALAQAGGLLPRVTAGASEAVALLESFGALAASVAASASDMAEDMRMIALNAQVQAAQAGEAGAGLLILAERTYLISEEIKVVTRSIGTEFAEAARQLDAAVSQGGALHAGARRQRERLAAGARTADERLESCRTETVDALRQLAVQLERLEQLAHGIQPELAADAGFCRPLAELRADLVAIAGSVETFSTPAAHADRAAGFFAAAKRRYSMAAERAVHESAVGGAAPALAAATAAPAGDAGNVEFF